MRPPQDEVGVCFARCSDEVPVLLRRRRDAGPFFHLHPGDELVAAVLRAEDRGLAFLHVEPVLAERIDDVGLVRDQNGVGPGLRRGAEQLRNASVRRLFSFGETTGPPSVRSAVFDIRKAPR